MSSGYFILISYYVNIALKVVFVVLGVYALILFIKALKIYINQNS